MCMRLYCVQRFLPRMQGTHMFPHRGRKFPDRGGGVFRPNSCFYAVDTIIHNMIMGLWG